MLRSVVRGKQLPVQDHGTSSRGHSRRLATCAIACSIEPGRLVASTTLIDLPGGPVLRPRPVPAE